MDPWDIGWGIIKSAVVKTAERQRWTLRHIVMKLALAAAIVLVAWLTGHLSAVSDRRDFILITLAALAIVFLLELIAQSYIATYDAGAGATGKTAKLKELYRDGRRMHRDGNEPRDVLTRWAGDVTEELQRAIPSERFGFETIGDELRNGAWVAVGQERNERLKLQLRKLRAILMRVDNAIPDDTPEKSALGR